MGKKNRQSRGNYTKEETYKIRCICGARDEGDDPTEAWIECARCGDWQHNVCMGISIYTEKQPKVYRCQDCAPEKHKELLDGMDKGERPWEKRREEFQEEEKRLEEERLTKKRKRDDEEPNGDSEIRNSVSQNGTKKFELTEKCHHYTGEGDVEYDIQKYFDQRYSIFSLYDEGIYMTEESWFGVTPEPVANKVSSDLSSITPASKTILIDLFAGAGGNSIAFALSNRWSQIISIEKDESVLACAQHNAEIYGVSDKITWVHGDCFEYLSTYKASIDPEKTVIFASPPWGGPGYISDEVFNLNTMDPYSLKQIHAACKEMDSALYLPRSSDLRQIARLVPDGKKVEVVQYCMQGASKALVAYIPAISSTST